jgi:hypothetical protein
VSGEDAPEQSKCESRLTGRDPNQLAHRMHRKAEPTSGTNRRARTRRQSPQGSATSHSEELSGNLRARRATGSSRR